MKRVETFAELHEALSSFKGRGQRWIFRGHGSAEWPLVPKAGRLQWLSGTAQDLNYFEAWKRRAVEYISVQPESDWDWLAIAQHHGLATRLLDWTFHPLSAAFFALECDTGDDAAIFAYRPRYIVKTEVAGIADISRLAMFRPRGVAQRIARQAAVFTVHNPPTTEISASEEGSRLGIIRLAHDSRRNLLRELDYYGVNRSALFPDLDGLAAYMNWFAENGYDVSAATEEEDV